MSVGKGHVSDVDKGWKKFLEPFLGSKPAIYSVWVGTDLDTLKATAPPMKTDVFYPYIVEHGSVKMAPRHFMAWTLDAHDQYRTELGRLAAHLLKNNGGDVTLTVVANLRQLGRQVVKDIQTSIQGIGCIDTSRMYRSMKVLRVGPDSESDKVGVVGELVQGAE
jgi:hypothetical protein